jgi:hypothetical protein
MLPELPEIVAESIFSQLRRHIPYLIESGKAAYEKANYAVWQIARCACLQSAEKRIFRESEIVLCPSPFKKLPTLGSGMAFCLASLVGISYNHTSGANYINTWVGAITA